MSAGGQITRGIVNPTQIHTEKMPHVTNPYLIPHHSAAFTCQIIKTMETGWK